MRIKPEDAMGSFVDLTGQKYHRLTALSFTNVKGNIYWDVVCDCGTKKVIKSNRWTKEDSPIKSCGCLARELSSKRRYKHGCGANTSGRQKEGYHSWQGLKDRCFNVNDQHYHYYGARGITACSAIAGDYLYFMSLVGPKPEKMSIDRIDTNGNYSCGSCKECNENNWPMNIRWADAKTQSNNRRNVIAARARSL